MSDYVIVDTALLEQAISAIGLPRANDTQGNVGLVAALHAVLTRPHPSLYVVLSGGMVQSIESDQPAVLGSTLQRITIVDFDTRGIEKTSLSPVQELDGSMHEAVVYEKSLSPEAMKLLD
jgi:hypothetical protein